MDNLDMPYPLSPKAERILASAVQEALAQRHHFIGTEHIFNGLCKSGDDLVLRAFAQDGVNPSIRRVIRHALIPGGSAGGGKRLHFTLRAQRLLQHSQEIAQGGGAGQIAPLHLLLGLLQAGDGVAVRLLRRLEHHPEKLETAARELLPQVDLQHQSDTPLLNSLGRDLTLLAREGRLDPVVGRHEEIRLMAQSLLRKKKNNLLLVGDAGVGKTSLVEGLAQLIVQGEAPSILSPKRIVEVSVGALVAGTRYRGDLEQRVRKILAEAKDPELILFIDEFHSLIGPAGGEGGVDIANLLKPALTGGELRMIGATTWKEYRTRIERDPAFERRFQVVEVRELSPSNTLTLLQQCQGVYEKHHQVKLAPDALEAAVDFSVRFLPDRHLPDKAIDLVDQACAQFRLRQMSAAVMKQAGAGPETLGIVDRSEVAQVLAHCLGLPLERLLQQADDPYLHLESLLENRIIGQMEAVRALSAALHLAHAGLMPVDRPRGIFFFVGPTGVGKTEMAKALADILYPGQSALVRLDMSEFMEKHAVAKLIGAPPGYVGYGDEGQLTGPLRRHPASVVLFDEVDKAHPEVLNLLLQVLDAGQLIDAKGRTVSFREALIIFTANILAFQDGPAIGFVAGAPEKQETGIDAELRRRFRPEFLNRLDKIINFYPLSGQVCRDLIAKAIEPLVARLKTLGTNLEVDENVYDQLLNEANYQAYGAREIQRIVNRRLAEPLSKWLVPGRTPPAAISVVGGGGKIEYVIPTGNARPTSAGSEG
jgi:ATP-dependent Clp protease ATP-binding subunit ClpC